jgi:uncharacterized membrane protein YeaQ/YmgE (transglycosylase-associated protein family)
MAEVDRRRGVTVTIDEAYIRTTLDSRIARFREQIHQAELLRSVPPPGPPPATDQLRPRPTTQERPRSAASSWRSCEPEGERRSEGCIDRRVSGRPVALGAAGATEVRSTVRRARVVQGALAGWLAILLRPWPLGGPGRATISYCECWPRDGLARPRGASSGSEVVVGIIAWIILGAIAGYITNLLMGGKEGVIATIILGIVGAVVGGWLMGTILKVADVTGLNIESIVVAVIGAVIVVAAFRLFTRRRIA